MDSFSADYSAYCPKCQRYYNPAIVHVCTLLGQDVDKNRKKLERWLGEFEKETN